ncbi:unnamed protein product [Amoebophrya sp. A25]|nr:unnamed protein product [Amoebophrya sp. A25]|eukprot:GSA25T00020545001.1
MQYPVQSPRDDATTSAPIPETGRSATYHGPGIPSRDFYSAPPLLENSNDGPISRTYSALDEPHEQRTYHEAGGNGNGNQELFLPTTSTCNVVSPGGEAMSRGNTQDPTQNSCSPSSPVTYSPPRRMVNSRLYSMFDRELPKYSSSATSLRERRYTVIVYHTSMERLAKRVQSLYPGKIYLIGPKFERFKDGWPNVAFTPEQVFRMQDERASVTYLASFHNPEIVFEQLAVIYALPKMLVRNYRIVVPWFATGTMERIETSGQIATAMTMARVLDCTPRCRTGPSIITIYDIHALQEQFYFSDDVLVELKSGVFLVKHELARMDRIASQVNLQNNMVAVPSVESIVSSVSAGMVETKNATQNGGLGGDPENQGDASTSPSNGYALSGPNNQQANQQGNNFSLVVEPENNEPPVPFRSKIMIGFPDDGAKKRFGSKFPEWEHVVIAKQRIGEKRICRIQDGTDVSGKHVILVDDLVQTGGTLIESMRALADAGAEKVSCYVTHAVFPDDSWRKFLDIPHLDTFYVCDTIPTTAATLEKVGKPFKVLSIAPLLGYLLVGREPHSVMRDIDKLDT